MKSWLLMAAVVACVAGGVQAGETTAQPSKAEWLQSQKAALAENLKQEGWQATSSGLQYHPVKSVGENVPKPRKGAEVAVHYEGKLTDGTVFDSSYQRLQPAVFPLGRVIKGWQEGVPMMRTGEIWEFLIPANLAYGEDGGGPIPGGATLFFKVELLAIKPGDEAK